MKFINEEGQKTFTTDIRTFSDYVLRMYTLSGAEVGDLWDDWFKELDDPMDRGYKLAMLYTVNYPKNKDVADNLRFYRTTVSAVKKAMK